MNKKLILLLLFVIMCINITGCKEKEPILSSSATNSDTTPAKTVWEYTDGNERQVKINSAERVVSIYGSFAECWQLAGGELVGVTEDAVSERGLVLDEKTEIVGTTKEPNLEKILSLSPDLVILSADIEAQQALGEPLTAAGIQHVYIRMDDYKQYIEVMEGFCKLTGRSDLYEKNVASVETQITNVLNTIPQQEEKPTVLLIRAFSTGAKAKADDNLAGIILRDLGADNIANHSESLLEELSLEAIIKEDPDYIFITIMGTNDQKAMQALSENIASGEGWQGLTAVKTDRVITLPKDLFHYKPNNQWGESYEHLAHILYETT